MATTPFNPSPNARQPSRAEKQMQLHGGRNQRGLPTVLKPIMDQSAPYEVNAVNVVKKTATGTVFTNNYGPMSSFSTPDPTYGNYAGDEMWFHFNKPFVPNNVEPFLTMFLRDFNIKVNVPDGTTRGVGGFIGCAPSYQDWDPTVLTYINRPMAYGPAPIPIVFPKAPFFGNFYNQALSMYHVIGNELGNPAYVPYMTFPYSEESTIWGGSTLAMEEQRYAGFTTVQDLTYTVNSISPDELTYDFPVFSLFPFPSFDCPFYNAGQFQVDNVGVGGWLTSFDIDGHVEYRQIVASYRDAGTPSYKFTIAEPFSVSFPATLTVRLPVYGLFLWADCSNVGPCQLQPVTLPNPKLSLRFEPSQQLLGGLE